MVKMANNLLAVTVLPQICNQNILAVALGKLMSCLIVNSIGVKGDYQSGKIQIDTN